MPELIAPTVRLYDAWTEAHEEWGPGVHEDGFALKATDDVTSPAGFAAWIARLTREDAPATPDSTGHVFRWIVEGDRVLGAIAMRYEFGGAPPLMGHLGYGIRPSARRQGLAGWALGRMLDEARDRGLEQVLVMCEAGNLGSARTIEGRGGILERVQETSVGPVRRYWIKL